VCLITLWGIPIDSGLLQVYQIVGNADHMPNKSSLLLFAIIDILRKVVIVHAWCRPHISAVPLDLGEELQTKPSHGVLMKYQLCVVVVLNRRP
jgi:hypothetical protein